MQALGCFFALFIRKITECNPNAPWSPAGAPWYDTNLVFLHKPLDKLFIINAFTWQLAEHIYGSIRRCNIFFTNARNCVQNL
jgi:hypothetical protein